MTEGCICSVLANAAYRSGAPDETPFIDPRCPLHALHVPCATFHARAVFGPPRPVLVLFVKGEIDRSNQEIDLREVTFLGVAVLSGLAQWRDRHGHVPRLVVAANGIVRRSLTVSGQGNDFELFSDFADAVLPDA